MADPDLPIDISPPVSPALAVWPGDTSVSREVLLDMGRGDHLTLSTLTTTVHVGAHVDAPSHYGRTAPSVDQVPLARCLGPCLVVAVEAVRGTRLGPDVADVPTGTERLLLRTGTYPDPEHFAEDFAALSPELVHRLADRGVRLIGIDTPSVDLFSSKELPAHRACLARDMIILEGLVLDHVEPGPWELLALPLKLEGFDASPVRAVLRRLRSP